MNIKKIICEAVGKDWGWCDPYWDNALICPTSNLLANPDCPVREERRFHKDDVPTKICAVHAPIVPPGPPIPRVKICVETKRLATRWCRAMTEVDESTAPLLCCRKHVQPRYPKVPYMVLFVVDLVSAAHLFTDAELEEFAKRLGAAGCDYVRAFLCWKRPGREYTLPFERVNGKADWDQPNPEWDKQMVRMQSILGKYGVGIWLDVFAQQYDRSDYPWSPFKYNINGFDTWRATRPEVLDRFRALIDRIVAAIGIDGNIIGWGNELVHPLDPLGDTPPQDEWAKAWVVPLANYLRAKGIPPPNPFSASDNMHGTGHSLYNRLVKQAGWDNRDTFWCLHGCAIPEHFDRFDIASVLKNYGISDDGVGLSTATSVPLAQQGLTVSQTGRRSSHWTYRIELVKKVQARLGKRLRSIEVMPMSLKWDTWTPSMLHQEEEVDVFWRIAEQVYDRDIRRSF